MSDPDRKARLSAIAEAVGSSGAVIYHTKAGLAVKKKVYPPSVVREWIDAHTERDKSSKYGMPIQALLKDSRLWWQLRLFNYAIGEQLGEKPKLSTTLALEALGYPIVGRFIDYTDRDNLAKTLHDAVPPTVIARIRKGESISVTESLRGTPRGRAIYRQLMGRSGGTRALDDLIDCAFAEDFKDMGLSPSALIRGRLSPTELREVVSNIYYEGLDVSRAAGWATHPLAPILKRSLTYHKPPNDLFDNSPKRIVRVTLEEAGIPRKSFVRDHGEPLGLNRQFGSLTERIVAFTLRAGRVHDPNRETFPDTARAYLPGKIIGVHDSNGHNDHLRLHPDQSDLEDDDAPEWITGDVYSGLPIADIRVTSVSDGPQSTIVEVKNNSKSAAYHALESVTKYSPCSQWMDGETITNRVLIAARRLSPFFTKKIEKLGWHVASGADVTEWMDAAAKLLESHDPSYALESPLPVFEMQAYRQMAELVLTNSHRLEARPHRLLRRWMLEALTKNSEALDSGHRIRARPHPPRESTIDVTQLHADYDGMELPVGSVVFDLEIARYGSEGEAAFASTILDASDPTRLHSYFARTPLEERGLIDWTIEKLKDAQTIITFNGAAADIGVLKSRADAHRIRFPVPSSHVDVYRDYWEAIAERSGKPRALKGFERQVAGIRRKHDVGGGQMATAYQDFIAGKRTPSIIDALRHNQFDVATTAYLVHTMPAKDRARAFRSAQPSEHL